MFKSIRKIKEIGFDKDLNNITNKLPENKEVCKDILKKLNNENVKIKEENAKQASLYMIINNTIIIADIKNTFTRIQTIAHECIHSVQNKKVLWFNFIFSNIYIFYFLVITIFALFNKINNVLIHALILTIAGFVFYVVRSYLEMDAMIKARYVAKDYLNDNQNLLTKQEIDLIISKYDYINEIGIRLTMFLLAGNCALKLIVFIAIYLI